MAPWAQGAGSCRELHGLAGQGLPSQARPTTPARGTGAAPALGIRRLHRDGDRPRLGCNDSSPMGSWRPASYDVTDAGTDGPEGTEMGSWAVGRVGGASHEGIGALAVRIKTL